MSKTSRAIADWQLRLEAALSDELPEFLSRQRWFGGKTRAIASARLEDAAWLDTAEPTAVGLVGVDYAGAESERFCLLLALLPEPGTLPRLGRIEGDDGSAWVEAGLHAESMRALLAGFDVAGELATVRGGRLRYGDVDPAGPRALRRAALATPIRGLGVEQSNTAVAIGRTHLFKLFRKLEWGENPELEMVRFLTTRTDFRALPALRGSLTWEAAAGTRATVGLLQDWVENQGDGWSHVLTGLGGIDAGRAGVEPLVRDVMALGRLTRELHDALASERTDPAFAPEAVSEADVEKWIGSLGARAHRVRSLLQAGLKQLGESAGALARVLVYALANSSKLVQLSPIAARNGFQKIRVHGDFHLGQTLKTDDGFVLIDFEGEPARPFAARRAKQCALKDVAGMLRSFDYALETARGSGKELAGREAPPLRAAFLEGYLEAGLASPESYLPASTAAVGAWLDFFELDKALYEVEYELSHRPDWVIIPIAGALRILRQTLGKEPMPKQAPAPALEGANEIQRRERRRVERSTTAAPPRAVIENVRPRVDEGHLPIKRSEGDVVEVLADVFVDGHEALTVELRHRFQGEERWSEIPMEPLGNDLWRASFTVGRLGLHEYTVEAWPDRFATWRSALVKKFDAGRDVSSELLEGAEMLKQAAQRAAGPEWEWLVRRARGLASDAPAAERVGLALDDALAKSMARHPDRSGAASLDGALPVRVDRERARFGAWYEMFPRSAGEDLARAATFREAEARLPAIAAMGFDVLYLPPIHPIGTTHRKGPNNALVAAPEDPGSPWAIGSEDGGHMSVDPALGTLADFDRFVHAAAHHGLEIAVDIAFQCSPDHPYVREHPEWFRHRPDGSIKYAENPPKKYEDIYPFDFECADWRGLWEELKNVVLFWVGHDVKIFRVDNPHTKPFPFWQWLIAEVQRQHPDTIFLAEAFTRPRVMQYLAKVGFTQSYTYFTWRNNKRELIDYFTELTQTEVREYLRPNLFANTPDILHEFLQTGGRPAFQIRLVLAATLGATYGIYGPPFELCETRAHPGTEEYVDSEKYQIRVWDHDRPGNIRDLITRVNHARVEHRALQYDHRLRFHAVDNEQLIAYTKTTPDLSDIVLVVVNLDPRHAQEGWVRLPLLDFGLPEHEPYQVHDLLSGERYLWQGERNFVRLDPHACPAHLFVIQPHISSEKDFDPFR